MPSGHSQCAWIFSSYFMYQLLHNKKTSKYMKAIQSLILIVFAGLMSYSRVYVEGCHTIQQVIVGAILGIIIGITGGYFKTKYIT
jgi:membrane-associated phospholipid phosphatase